MQENLGYLFRYHLGFVSHPSLKFLVRQLQVLQGCHHLIEWVGQVGLSRFHLLTMHIRDDSENTFKKKQGSYGTVSGEGCKAG